MAAELAAAEQLLNAGQATEALAKAKAAATGGSKEQAGEALRLQALALLGADRYKEGLDLAKSELDSARAGGDQAGEGSALLALATVLLDSRSKKGAREEALQHATAATTLAGQVGNRRMEINALLLLSRCLTEKEGAEAKVGGQEALGHASRAREMCIELGDKKLEGQALHHLSQAHVAMGEMEAALEDCDEAMDLFLELKDKHLEAVECLTMAQIHMKNGAYDRAISDAEDAVELFQALKSAKEVSAIGVIFQAYTMKQDTRRALRTAREAVKRFKKLGNNKMAEAETLQMLVSAYVASNQLDEALGAAERALTMFQDMGHQQSEAKMSSVISGLHLRMSRFDRALQCGEDASMLFREAGGDTMDKADAMFNIVESHMQKKDHFAALQAAGEMRTHFQKEGDIRGEAGALMTMSQVSVRMEKYEDALNAATRAQVMLGEDGFQYGEASALRLLAEVLSKKGDHKQAVRAAERSRTIFRELSEREDEAHSLYIVGQEAISLAVAEGAKVGEGASSRGAADALNKASKSADSAVKMAREIPNAEGLLGSALCVLAQVQMLNGQPDEAIALADEAVVLFRDVGSAISEANALLLSADALRVKQSYKDAGEAAEEALRLFQTVDPPEAKGESLCQEILDHLEDIKKEQQQAAEMRRQMQAAVAAGGPMAGPMMSAPMGGDAMPDAVASAGRAMNMERGAALDLSGGADLSVIKAKVIEIALRITGAEEGEIDTDTPLMEAGLTSNSALILRDELTQELPGISLPVTLVFDYPSIGAMAELIMENSAKKALK